MSLAGSIIIVTFNSAEHIAPCLASVNDPAWERIVVDNASRDATLARARGVAGVTVLANSENRGFAAAANQGARAARGALLLFLNPDVLAEPGALAALRAGVAAESVVAAGGRLLHPDGATQVGFTVRRFPTLGTMLAEILLLNRLLPGSPWNRRYRCLDFDYEKPREVEQPAGACLLVKRSAWEAAGGFDERFFPLWFEDVDLCRRLRAAGGKIVYEPGARFRHAGAHSLPSIKAGERQLFWYRNLLRYFRKHHGGPAAAVLRVAIFFGMLLRIAAAALGAGRDAGPGDYAQVIRRCVFGFGE
jgi:GT2 family glycosyltransferase